MKHSSHTKISSKVRFPTIHNLLLTGVLETLSHTVQHTYTHTHTHTHSAHTRTRTHTHTHAHVHTHTHTHTHTYTHTHTPTPPHITPAVSLRGSQLCAYSSFEGQSISMSSVPLHVTSSRKITPSPAPK